MEKRSTFTVSSLGEKSVLCYTSGRKVGASLSS